MRFSRIILLISILCLLYSCKKNTGLSGYIKDLDFSYSDSLSVGKKIKFYSNAPAGSTFLWTFGTGETSTLDSPEYRYSVPRPYMVTLQINDTGKPFTKTLYISIGLDILSKITASRAWSVHYTAHNPSGTPADIDTVYADNAAFFSINNDTSLSTASNILSYIAPPALLPASKILKFGVGNIGSTGSSWAVAYYEYQKDSLDYTIYTPLTGGYLKYDYTSTH